MNIIEYPLNKNWMLRLMKQSV